MALFIPLAGLLGFQADTDPFLLPINTKEKVVVQRGLTDLRTVTKATPADVAKAAEGARFVLVGESHTSPEDHQLQADVIQALVDRGRNVVVGFEMFTRPNQMNLNPWTLGRWTEEEFIQKADWKGQWGFDFALYRPIFETVRKNRLPMAALNVPRDWVRAVGKSGPTGLTAEQQAQVPQLYLGNEDHKKVFTALMGGHPMTGAQGDNIYAAQVLWDEAMADSAIKYMDRFSASSKAVMVICVGSGHTLHTQGLNWRIKRRTGEPLITVVCTESEGERAVNRGVGEFVFVGPPIKEQ